MDAPFSVAVEFMFSGPPLGPNTMCIKQSEFAHDVAILEFWADDVETDSYASGTPMVITYGRPYVKRTFYGYVNHAERTNNALSTAGGMMNRNSTTVVCVGASYWMKEAGTQVWTAQTASQVVAQIATQFGLDSNIDFASDTTIWPKLPMGGLSYWQFCCSLAQRIGYTFYCNGVQLVFKARQTNPKSVTSLAALYDYRSDPASLPIFTPTLGATNPTGGVLANRSAANVNPRTNSTFYVSQSGSPSPTSLGTTRNTPVFDATEHFTAASQQEAQTKIQGIGGTNQMYLSATATAAGDPLLSQGSLVGVINANGSQNGLWFVSCAEHKMNQYTYTMDLDLGRDSLGATNSISGNVQSASPPTAVMQQQKWIAA